MNYKLCERRIQLALACAGAFDNPCFWSIVAIRGWKMLRVDQVANRWQLHCAAHTVKALLPFKRQLRAVKRRIASSPHVVAESSVYPGGFDHISALRDAGFTLEGKHVLELGTGWFPVIPLMLRLGGASRVYLTDVEHLLDQNTILVAADFLLSKKEDLAQKLNIDIAGIEQLLLAPRNLSFDGLLQWFQLAYICPFDAGKDLLSVDCIVSHTVLEHIPEHVLRKIFRDTRSLLRPGGLHSHGIDHTDHRANVDPRLSRVDFLRYNDWTWRLFCINAQDYTNRLRHSDYVSMLREARYKIVFERKFVNERCAMEAKHMKLWGRFRDMDVEDLATAWSHVVAKPC